MKFFNFKRKPRDLDLNNLDNSLIEDLTKKKVETSSYAQSLDAKIFLIQNSTRTLIPVTIPLHNFLRMRFRWYYNWHLKPYARNVHWAILGVSVTAMMIGSFFSITIPNPEDKYAAAVYSCSSQATGNWSDAATWTNCNSGVPATGDTATITGGYTVTLTGSTTVGYVNIVSGNTLVISSQTLILDGVGSSVLTVGGTFTVTSSTVQYTGTNTATVLGTTYNNLTLSPASGKTFTLGGTTTVNGAFQSSTGNFDTGNQTLNVTGNFTLTSGNYTMGSSTITVAGNYNVSGAGTINVNTSTVKITGSSTITIKQFVNNFYNLWTAYTSKSALIAGCSTACTETITNVLTLNGDATGSLASASGTVWLGMYKSGTGAVTSNGATISITVRLCFGAPSSTVVIPAGTFYGGLFFMPSGNYTYKLGGNITTSGPCGVISGTNGYVVTLDTDGYNLTTGGYLAIGYLWGANTSDGEIVNNNASTDSLITVGDYVTITDSTDNKNKINGVGSGGKTLNFSVAGDWTMATGETFTPGASTVTFTGNSKAINGTIASQTFNHIIVNKTAGQTLSIGGSTTSLTAANFTETQGNFTPPATFSVSGDLTLTAGTLTAGTNMNIGGSWTKNGGTFTSGSNTVTFNGTATGKTINPGASAGTFYNVIFNGSGGAWSPLTNTMTITNDLTMTAGTFDTSNGTASVTVNGHVACGASCGTINMTSTNTFTQNVASNKNFGTSVAGTTAWTFYNLTVTSSSGTPTITTSTTGSGDITINNVINIGASTTFSAGNRTYHLLGTGTPFTNNGTFTCGTSTFSYENTTSASIILPASGAQGFYNLQTNPASGTPTYTMKTTSTSFLAGTKVKVENGEQNIELLKVGDKVLSYDINTNQPAMSEVTEIINSTKDEYYIINGKVKATGNHVFILPDNSQKKVEDFKVGDILKTYSGTETITTIEKVTETVPVYDIEVKDYHLFYAENYLVHNAQQKTLLINNNLTLTTSATGSAIVNAYILFLHVAITGNMSIGANQTYQAGLGLFSGGTSIGGNYSNSGTFTHNNGTVRFDKASGTQTVDTGGTGATKDFYNIVITNSGTTVQLINNNMTLATGGTISENFTTGGTWDLNGRTLTLGANLSTTMGTIAIGTGTLAGGTYTVTIGTGATVTQTTGTLTASDLTISGTATYTCSGNSVINISGNLVISSSSWTPSTSTITMSGTTKTINSTQALGNLTTTGTITLAAVTTVGINFQHSTGTFSTGNYNFTVTGNLTISSGTYTMGSSTIEVSGDYNTSGAGTINPNTSTVNIKGQNKTITSKSYVDGFYNLNTVYKFGSANTVNWAGSPNITHKLALISDSSSDSLTGTWNYVAIYASGSDIFASAGAKATNVLLTFLGTSDTTIPGGGVYTGANSVYNCKLWLLPNDNATFTLGGEVTTGGGTFGGNLNNKRVTVDLAGYNLIMSNVFLSGLNLGQDSLKTATIKNSGSSATITSATDLAILSGSIVDATDTGNINLSIARNLTINSGGTYTAGSGTATISGYAYENGSITTNAQVFNNLTINNTQGTYNTVTISGNLDVNGTFTLTKGILQLATNDPQLNLAGAVSIAATGTTWTKQDNGSAKTVFDGTSTFTDSTGTQDIGLVEVNGTSLTLATNMTVNTMTVTSGILNLGSGGYVLIIGGSGTNPLSNSGTFTAGTSTVRYTGTSATTIAPLNYSTLEFKPAGTVTYTLGSGTLQTTSNFTVGNGTNACTATAATNNTIIDVNGTFTVAAVSKFTASGSAAFTVAGSWLNSSTATGAFTHSSGTVTFDGSGTTNTINMGSSSSSYQFYNVVFNGTGAWSPSTNTLYAANNLTMTAGTLNTANGTANVSVAGNAVGTAGIIDMTSAGTNTFTMTGSSKNFGIDGVVWKFYVLTISGSASAQGSGEIWTTNGIGFGMGGGPLNAGNRTWRLKGFMGIQDLVGDDFVIQTSTVSYEMTSSAMVSLPNYYNLQFSPASGSPTYSLMPPGGIPCLLPNTIISSSVGDKKVSELIVGDTVWSYDFVTKQKVLSNVIKIDKNTSENYYKINNKIKATFDHVFYLSDGTLKEVKDLRIGDKLLTDNGDEVINALDIINESSDVYDVSLNGVHNYYADGYLVHNTNTNGTITVQNNLTMTGGGGSATLTGFSLSPNFAPDLTVVGNVSIGSGQTITVNNGSDGAPFAFKVGGSWSNSGTFNPSTGTVTFKTTTTSTISGATTFHNLVMNSTTDGAKTINFPTGVGNVTTIQDTWTLDGASGKVLTLQSSTPDTAWYFDIAAPFTAGDYINVKDSYSNDTNKITPGANTTNSGNNDGWIFNVAPNTPTSLAQNTVGDVTIATGNWVSATSVKFAAIADDPDASDTLYLCVEKDYIETALSSTNGGDNCGTGVAYSGTPVEVTVTITGLTDAKEYHWQAQVKDTATAYSAFATYGANTENPPTNPAARDFGLDTTAPTGGTVNDGTGADQDWNDGSLTSLSANWSSFNSNVSGIQNYKYVVRRQSDGYYWNSPNWQSGEPTWTSNGTDTSVTVSSINLQTAVIYYFSVKATDNAGNIETAVTSNGQQVTPTLSFSMETNTISFVNLSGSNDWLDSQPMDLLTSTNASNGYSIRAYTTQLLSSDTPSVKTIDNFAGTWTTPILWPAGTYGFGYTSSDVLVSGSNRYATGTKYAGFTQTPSGDIVADYTSAINGSTGALVDDSTTITYKVAVSNAQQALQYSTQVIYNVTANY